MPYRIFQITEDELVVSIGTGIILPEEIVKAFQAVIKVPGYNADFDRLIFIDNTADLSQFDFPSMNTVKNALVSEMETAGENAPVEPAPHYRAAIVCSDKVKNIAMKLYSNLWANDPNQQADFKLFSNVNDALEWLGKPGAVIPPMV
jgi:hypothetical protein